MLVRDNDLDARLNDAETESAPLMSSGFEVRSLVVAPFVPGGVNSNSAPCKVIHEMTLNHHKTPGLRKSNHVSPKQAKPGWRSAGANKKREIQALQLIYCDQLIVHCSLMV